MTLSFTHHFSWGGGGKAYIILYIDYYMNFIPMGCILLRDLYVRNSSTNMIVAIAGIFVEEFLT
jgi:hypothetical protein